MRWLLMLAGLASAPAWADPAPSPFSECDAAITAAAKLPAKMPDKLLPAIARVESGRLDAGTGRVRPWPWTINVEGAGYFYDSKEQVISAVQQFQAKGVRSIDVGCMQVNLMHHPKAFADLQEAFDPAANARYAVKFLTALYQQTKDWNLATAWYHSQSPDRGEEYQRLVFGRVMTPMGASGGVAGKQRGPYGAWPTPGERYAAMPPISLQFGAFAPAKPTVASFAGIPVTPVPSLAQLSLPTPFGAQLSGKQAFGRK
jgi:hypothetical protein